MLPRKVFSQDRSDSGASVEKVIKHVKIVAGASHWFGEIHRQWSRKAALELLALLKSEGAGYLPVSVVPRTLIAYDTSGFAWFNFRGFGSLLEKLKGFLRTV
jgi:hypothetical protein